MTATTIGPVAGPKSLRFRTLLQQQLTSGVEEERRKRAVQKTVAIVTRCLGQIALFPVVFVDEYQLFGFRRNHPVYVFHVASLSLMRSIVE